MVNAMQDIIALGNPLLHHRVLHNQVQVQSVQLDLNAQQEVGFRLNVLEVLTVLNKELVLALYALLENIVLNQKQLIL